MLQVLWLLFTILFLLPTKSSISFQDQKYITPGIATSYSAVFNSDASQFFVLGIGTSTILRYVFNPNTTQWDKQFIPITSTKPYYITWQDDDSMLVAVNNTHLKTFTYPYLSESTISFSSQTMYLASSSKLTAICRSNYVFVYTNNPPQYLDVINVCSSCQNIAATDYWIIVDTPNCYNGDDNTVDKVTLIDCSSGFSCNKYEDTPTVDPSAVAVADPYYFTGNPNKNSNDGDVEVYLNNGNNNWNYQTNFAENSNDQVGALLDVNKGGNLLATFASNSEDIIVYYYSNYSWNKHVSITSGYLSSSQITARRLQIRQTQWGYLLLVSTSTSSSSITSAGVIVINVTCSSTNYGQICQTNCLCNNGVCNNSMWSNGNCVYCNGNYFGPTCNQQCTCMYGKCNSSINGNGKCLSCNTNYFGSDCKTLCTCINGVCNDNIGGDGKCLSCNGKYYGANCNLSCSCVNGTCNNGINGNGYCSVCSKSYYNQNCSQHCSSCNICSDGISGNGTCYNCSSGYFGSQCGICSCINGECSNDDGHCLSCNNNTLYGIDCEKSCSCIHGTCDSGISGSGNCTCYPDYYGKNCSFHSLCINGNPDDGVLGNDKCKSCNSTFFGPYCNQTCLCSDLSNCNSSNGQCLSCSTDKFGPYCNRTCTCKNGTCDSDIDGDGTCLYCDTNFFGPNCNQYCTCGNGTCNYDDTSNTFTGQCSCNDGFSLNLSDMKTCLPCADKLSCSYGSYIISSTVNLNVSLMQIGNLIVDSSHVFLSNTITSDLDLSLSTINIIDGSLIIINGNIHSASSIINLSHGTVQIQGNAYLSNTTLRLSSNSTLTIGGCITINNMTIDLDFDSYSKDQSINITLITFADNCQPLQSFNIVGETGSDCEITSATSNVLKNSVVVTLVKDSRCQSDSGTIIPYWGMITIYTISALIGIIIIVILLGFLIPELRHQLFPFRDQVPDYTL